jgi:hypothetical protein
LSNDDGSQSETGTPQPQPPEADAPGADPQAPAPGPPEPSAAEAEPAELRSQEGSPAEATPAETATAHQGARIQWTHLRPLSARVLPPESVPSETSAPAARRPGPRPAEVSAPQTGPREGRSAEAAAAAAPRPDAASREPAPREASTAQARARIHWTLLRPVSERVLEAEAVPSEASAPAATPAEAHRQEASPPEQTATEAEAPSARTPEEAGPETGSAGEARPDEVRVETGLRGAGSRHLVAGQVHLRWVGDWLSRLASLREGSASEAEGPHSATPQRQLMGPTEPGAPEAPQREARQPETPPKAARPRETEPEVRPETPLGTDRREAIPPEPEPAEAAPPEASAPEANAPEVAPQEAAPLETSPQEGTPAEPEPTEAASLEPSTPEALLEGALLSPAEAEGVAPDPLPELASRLRTSLTQARALAKAGRFLEIAAPEGSEATAPGDSFAALAPAFRGWRQALRERDLAGALESAERASGALEACRQAILERDRTIQAFRVRWACDHEPGVRSLARLLRFYRLLPYSPATQSKFEFVLTRLFAGPLRPHRTLAEPPQALVRRLAEMERAWGAHPIALEPEEVSAIARDLEAFTLEASQYEDLAKLTASSVVQRAGTYKAALGEKIFDPRVAVATVECTVALGNAVSELSARDETAAASALEELAGEAPEPQVALAQAALSAEVTDERDALEELGRMERLLGAPEENWLEVAVDGLAVEEAPTEPTGLAGPETERPGPEPGNAQPSLRARELAKVPENAALMQAYLREPRSLEIYQLDLDRFLGPLPPDAQESLGDTTPVRRRALELILAADDLTLNAGAPDAEADEHRARVKELARAMGALATSLRALATKARQGAPRGVKPLLYVADNLVWERLRLESLAKRAAPRRLRISLDGPSSEDLFEKKEPLELPSRRQSVTIALALAATMLLGLGLSTLYTPRALDTDVRVLDPKTLPGGEHVEDARVGKPVLFLTVRRSWTWQSASEKREHIEALARFVADQGVDVIAVTDRFGAPLASLAGGETVLVEDTPVDPEPGGR